MLSDELETYREGVRRAIERRLSEGAGPRALADSYPSECLEALADIKVAGLNLSPAYGGEEVGFVAEGVVAEELARVDMNAAFWFLGSRRQGKAIEVGGSSEMQDAYLADIINAKIWTAWGSTEPSSGNDIQGMRTRAERRGDKWVVNGEKTSVSAGMLSPFIIIFARTIIGGEESGLTSFIVPVDTPGLQRTPFRDGVLKPMGRCSAYFDDLELSDAHVIGEPGRGGRLALATFQAARPIAALMALGCAAATLEETIGYTRERVVMGRPIGGYQGASFRVADAATAIHAARLACYHALQRLDETGRDEVATSMAKLHGTHVACDVMKSLMEVWGHYAFTHEYPLLQRYNDVTSTLSWDGSSDIHRLVIARALIGREITG